MTPCTSALQIAPARRQAGLSLIELMISMAIGLLLLAAITSLIVSQSANRDELEKSSRQIENGRYASQILRDDIQHAGFYGQAFLLPNPPAALPNPCLTSPAMGSPSLMEAMPVPIQGYDSPASSPITTCLPDADFVHGTDILVIRRADTNYSALDTTGQVFIQTSAASTVMATGTGSTWGTDTSTFPLFFDQLKTVAVPLRKYFVHIYFLSPCSNPTGTPDPTSNLPTCQSTDDNGNPIPTLKRLELSYNGTTTTWSLVPLVEGIENMQFDWGTDTDGDGYPNQYTPTPVTSTDWSNVMAVRINLLARNLDCTHNYQDTKTYNLGLTTGITPASAVGCTNGDYRRHVFTELVRAINPSSRRASQ